MKSRDEVVRILVELKPYLQQRYKVRGLSLFGSVGRGEHKETSDVDVLVEFNEDADLFDLSGLGLFLEEKLGLTVDVVPRKALREELRDEVQSQAVPV